jgi:hypothetical protein
VLLKLRPTQRCNRFELFANVLTMTNQNGEQQKVWLRVVHISECDYIYIYSIITGYWMTSVIGITNSPSMSNRTYDFFSRATGIFLFSPLQMMSMNLTISHILKPLSMITAGTLGELSTMATTTTTSPTKFWSYWQVISWPPLC